jgi:hypothetical protein
MEGICVKGVTDMYRMGGYYKWLLAVQSGCDVSKIGVRIFPFPPSFLHF